MENLFLTIVSLAESKRTQFREKLVDINRIRKEVDDLSKESNKQLLLDNSPVTGKPIYRFTPEELSWGAFGEEHADLGLTYKEEEKRLNTALPTLPLLAYNIARAKDVLEIEELEKSILLPNLEQQERERKEREEAFEKLLSVETNAVSIDSALEREKINLGVALGGKKGDIDFDLIKKELKVDPIKEFAQEQLIKTRLERILKRFQDGFLLDNDSDLAKLSKEISEFFDLPLDKFVSPLSEADNDRLVRLKEVDAMIKQLASYFLLSAPTPERKTARDSILKELVELSNRITASTSLNDQTSPKTEMVEEELKQQEASEKPIDDSSEKPAEDSGEKPAEEKESKKGSTKDGEDESTEDSSSTLQSQEKDEQGMNPSPESETKGDDTPTSKESVESDEGDKTDGSTSPTEIKEGEGVSKEGE